MNISEIAKLAGVSSAAVSRYFNNGYISEEKKEAIRKVVEQTGYRPSVQAQTLRTKKNQNDRSDRTEGCFHKHRKNCRGNTFCIE